MVKESYFNDEFIEKMREKYYSSEKLEKLEIGNVAILAIDLQKVFLGEGFHVYLPSSPVFVDKLRKFYTKMKNTGLPIIFTHHCHEKNIMSRWWGSDMPCGDKSTEIDARLSIFADEVINKHTYDAFYDTDLENILRKMNVDTVIITGVMTHLCCETTARSAFVRGFNVIFPLDGTITQNSKQHECTLSALSHGFAVTPTLKDFEELVYQQSE